MSGSKKLPSMQWYPGDWRKDPGVQSMTLAERGAWWEILQLMWESPKRGLLLLPSGSAMPISALSRVLGENKQEVEQIVSTLVSYGVAERDPETGALMNRRMYREDVVRQQKAKAGSKGGKTSKGGGRPPKEQAENKQTGKQTTTSSVSSSPSGNTTTTKNAGADRGAQDRPGGSLADPEEIMIAMVEDLVPADATDMPSRKLRAQAQVVARGEDRKAWETPDGTVIPPEQRPEIFRAALGYHSDGTQKAFRSSVRYAVKLFSDPPSRASPNLSPADRKMAERIMALRGIDLETFAS